VRLHAPYGMLFSVISDCLGLCLFGWLIYSLAGRWAVALGVLLYVRWFLLAFCSACGGNEMIETLRTKKGRFFFFFFIDKKRFIKKV
jgi:hypothetical protein